MIEFSGGYDGVFLLTGLLNLIAAMTWLVIWSDKPIGVPVTADKTPSANRFGSRPAR